MKKDIIEMINKCAVELTGKEASEDVENLHINFDFEYKKSLLIEAGGSFTSGNDTYNCEVIIKINKVTV